MFPAQVYRIMIGCPGDVEEEVSIAQVVIRRWTGLHAEQSGVVLLPLHWSTDSYPVQGDHPQTLLNGQLASRSDMLIGIFGSRIGSPTDRAKSGTIEEIEEHIKAGKPVMLFFRRFNDISRASANDIGELEVFKNEMKRQGLYKEYDTANDFEKTLTDALELFLADHWLKDASATQKTNDATTATVPFSDKEKEVLKNWTASDHPYAHYSRYKGGTLFSFGDEQIDVTNGRELVRWKDFFSRLEDAGFIEIDRYNQQGNPVYQPRQAAYDYIDSFEKQ